MAKLQKKEEIFLFFRKTCYFCGKYTACRGRPLWRPDAGNGIPCHENNPITIRPSGDGHWVSMNGVPPSGRHKGRPLQKENIPT
ncbi:hypothetical protein [Prevotella sp. AGR2160]|uniref:hypothetical protein n=1 Tax=Prevotella sp. AGR2160 TaxID=1280674 RepID=UPI0012DD5503|nr:hypothetical protein [Prevotella sp. AGR2160]